MAYNVATAYLDIVPSFEGLGRELERQMRGVDTRRAGRTAGDGYTEGFSGAAKKLTGVLAGAFAAVSVGSLFTDAVDQASDLQESATKLEAVFGDGTAAINEFASQGAKALGQSNLAIKDAAATFGVYGKAAGLAGQENAKFSSDLVSLSTDLASFYNEDPAAVVEALGAGLRGEAEPLRRFGILMDDATLRAKAMELGLTATTKDALQPQQKVLAAQALILEQTSVAQGDFARTSGGLANQQRILSAQWTDMKGQLGQAFLPGVTAVVAGLNERLFPALGTAKEFVGDLWSILGRGQFTGLAGLYEDHAIVDFLFDVREGAVAAGTYLGRLWDSAGPTMSRAWAAMQPMFVQVGGILRQTFAELGPVFRSVWDALRPLVDQLVAVLPALLTGLNPIGVIFKALAPVLPQIAAAVGELVVGIGKALAGALQVIIPIVSDLVSEFVGLLPVLLELVTSLVPPFLDLIRQLAPMFADLVAEVVPLIAHLVAGLVPVIVELVAAIVPMIAAILPSLIELFAAVVPVVMQIVATIAPLIVQIASALIPVIQALMPIVTTVFSIFGQWVTTVANVLTWMVETIAVPLITLIGATLSAVWHNVLRPTWDAIWGAIQWVGEKFSWLWDNIVRPVFEGIGTAIRWAWDHVIEPVFELMKAGLTGVGNFFAAVGDGIGAAWSKIKEWVAAPINWVIEHVWNNGIVSLWNKIIGWIPFVDLTLGELSLIGVDKSAPRREAGTTGFVNIPYTTGGVLPGYSHIDNHRVILSGGEGILNPEAVRGLGPDFVHWANREFGGARVATGYTGGPQGAGNAFFLGGLWDGIKNVAGGIGNFVSGVVGGIVDAASFTSGFISDPLGTIMGLLGPDVVGGIESMGTGGSAWGNMLSKLPGSIIGGVISSVKGFLGLDDDGRGGPPPVPASGFTPGYWGPDNPGGNAANTQAAIDFIRQQWPSVTSIGGWRASGSVSTSDHPRGKALDAMIPAYRTPGGIALGTAIAEHFVRSPDQFGTKYVIWRDRINNMNGWRPYSHPGGNNDTLAHRDHVHVSFLTGPAAPDGKFARGDDARLPAMPGFSAYDSGGMLQPGVTTVFNGTGSPEPVFTPAQWDTVSRAVDYTVSGDGILQPTIIARIRIGDRELRDVVVEAVDTLAGDATHDVALMGGRS